NGVVALTTTPGGVDVHLVQVERRQWLPIAIAHAMPSLRVDAVIDVTVDNTGNRTHQRLVPALYLCSCYGTEDMVATHVQVSAIAVSRTLTVARAIRFSEATGLTRR